MSSEVAIAARGMSKAYLLYPTPRHRLHQALRPRPARPRCSPARAPLLHRALGAARPELRGEARQDAGGDRAQRRRRVHPAADPVRHPFPTAGEVQVPGRVAELLELGSGFNPEYTGHENVPMNATVLGLSQEETEARREAILAFADIGDFVEQPVKTYSSGMAMRLAFAVITHVDADVLVAEEALSVGDAYFRQKCMRWLRDIEERGTLLFCGHDMGAVMGLCERPIWLDKGRLRMEGPARTWPRPTACSPTPRPWACRGRRCAPLPRPCLRRRPEPEEATNLPVLRLDGAAYGSGLAEVVEVRLTDPSGRPLPIVGGERRWR